MPPLDRDLLEVEVRRLQAERVRAAGRAEVAILQLKQLLGMDPAEPLLLRREPRRARRTRRRGSRRDRAAPGDSA